MHIRAMTKADFDFLLGEVDAWWGGREIRPLLHPAHLYQFGDMAFVADVDGAVAGFIVGFVSQTAPDEAYVHLAATSPTVRGQGVGRALYARFCAVAAARGCRRVKGITTPTNTDSIAFHRRLGFEATLTPDYSGPGLDRVVLMKWLGEGA